MTAAFDLLLTTSGLVRFQCMDRLRMLSTTLRTDLLSLSMTAPLHMPRADPDMKKYRRPTVLLLVHDVVMEMTQEIHRYCR